MCSRCNHRFQAPLPPVQPEFEIERILDSAYRRGILNFRIKWLGYPISEASWKRADQMDNAQEIVQDWYKAHPEAPRDLRKPVPIVPTTTPRPKRGGGKVKIRVVGGGECLIKEQDSVWRPLVLDTNVERWPSGPLTRNTVPLA